MRWTWVLFAGCGGGSALYAPCEAADDCPAPEGVQAECLDKSGAGFCTWSCTVDADCAFDEDAWARVCAPFEDEGGTHCFPACNEGDATTGADGTGAVCPDGYGCRSTGGGADNQRVCFPEG
ncbi:MAG: hypothetical protein R3F59_03885 [Myxococcota bacterium]